MLQTEDAHLIRRALVGDQKAFDGLYKTYHPRIHNVVIYRTNREEAEDLVQVTFIRAFQNLDSFRGESAFLTWLTRIALNVCNSHLQAQQIRQNRLRAMAIPEPPPAPDQTPALYDSPEERMHRKECEALVMHGIQTLSPHYRQAMWLRYVHDRSYKEITRSLQVPMGTLKTWLWRGRRELRDKLRSLQ